MGHQHVLQLTKTDQMSSLPNVQLPNYRSQNESLVWHHLSRMQNGHLESNCEVDYIGSRFTFPILLPFLPFDKELIPKALPNKHRIC